MLLFCALIAFAIARARPSFVRSFGNLFIVVVVVGCAHKKAICCQPLARPCDALSLSEFQSSDLSIKARARSLASSASVKTGPTRPPALAVGGRVGRARSRAADEARRRRGAAPLV